MRLVWTDHVNKRTRERGIQRKDVEHALANFHSSWPTPEGSIQYVGPARDGRELKIWLVAPGLSASRPIVKSTAWKDVDDEPSSP